MKIGLTILTIIIGGLMTNQLYASEWEIDPNHSSIEFAVKHMMISTVKGEFKKYNASIQFDNAKPEIAKIEAQIDVSSIDTRNSQRDEHLKSADFFDVTKYPQMTFKSKKITKINGNKYQVIGDLTIKGVTKEIILEGEGFSPILKNPWGKMVTGVHATAFLNRKDYGLTWNAALETGGVLVGEEVKIELNLELVKKD
ncbi:MAG: YceI family protein [bacterium]|nr:YceI family protein [bacterium]